MAFKIEYLKTREELSKLGVDNYETELTKRSIFMGEKKENLWDEFGDNHFIHIDEEQDIWLIYLGLKTRHLRDLGEKLEDIFLFNYKGFLIELMLKAKEGTLERMFHENFGVTYVEILQMNPSFLPNIDNKSLINLICKAMEATEIGENFLAEFGKEYASKLISKKIKCEFPRPKAPALGCL